jgi:DNA-binding NarL/FixJ family response regulator
MTSDDHKKHNSIIVPDHIIVPDQLDATLSGPVTGVEVCRISKLVVSDNFVADPRLEAALAPPAHTNRELLAPREREVMDMVAQGESSENIAHALSISTVAVTKTLTRAYRKLGVRNRAEAVRVWLGE